MRQALVADIPGTEVGWWLELLRPSTLLHRALLTCGVLGTQALLGNFSQCSKAQTYSQSWKDEKESRCLSGWDHPASKPGQKQVDTTVYWALLGASPS